jgi:predicted nucleotidyltransferase
VTGLERLKRIKGQLATAYGNRLKGVVLYGSEARGESEPESDIDVLVVLEGPVDYGRELRTCIHETYPLTLKWERPINPEPVDVDEYEAGEWPLYRNAQQEGVAA